MNIIKRIQFDSNVYGSIFFLLSIILLSILLTEHLIIKIIDIIILSITLLIRKELYFHRNISYRVDFFRLIFFFHILHHGFVYTIIITNISVISIFIIKNVFNLDQNTYLIGKGKFSYLEVIQKDIEKQKMNNYFIEYTLFFISFFFCYFIFEQIPFIRDNGIILFTLLFMSLWVIVEKFLLSLYEKFKIQGLNSYVKNFFSRDDKKVIPITLEITLHFIFFICLFYTFINSNLLLGLLLTIFLISFRDNTYISNQVLTFIILIVELLEKKDRYTFDHSYRVALISYNISKQLNLDINDVDRIYKAAIIHDVGKIIIPDEILQKKGKLTKEEFETIKLHVKELKNILNPIYQFIKEIVDIAELHHERLDGNGYPYGYKSPNIPLESRILAIADTFDALIIDRPYRPGFSFQKALSILKEDAQKNKLDMLLVDIFIKTIPQTEIVESVKKVKTMLKIYQGKIINNMISSLSDFIDEII
ncbi:MAG: HD domain-containing protein [Candidatus Calescibacterium sp.]|nr:HD domain-containing protein [Candidatus Calescibacterium sp.]MDW8132172.1 HD domain-containing protein [Candidatus Calescibacterium sp.]